MSYEFTSSLTVGGNEALKLPLRYLFNIVDLPTPDAPMKPNFKTCS